MAAQQQTAEFCETHSVADGPLPAVVAQHANRGRIGVCPASTSPAPATPDRCAGEGEEDTFSCSSVRAEVEFAAINQFKIRCGDQQNWLVIAV